MDMLCSHQQKELPVTRLANRIIVALHIQLLVGVERVFDPILDRGY